MHICHEALQIPGAVVEQWEIPSDEALVTPLVVRVVERLTADGLIGPEARMRTELCLDEAITNSVKHGNRREFAKRVVVSLFREPGSWGLVIQDEGTGFSLRDLKDRTQGDELWAENGRGIPLLTLYMDEVGYYGGGNTLLLRQHLADTADLA
ncbi:MAG: ATP-binding protein [Planctomycetota bacterium]